MAEQVRAARTLRGITPGEVASFQRWAREGLGAGGTDWSRRPVGLETQEVIEGQLAYTGTVRVHHPNIHTEPNQRSSESIKHLALQASSDLGRNLAPVRSPAKLRGGGAESPFLVRQPEGVLIAASVGHGERWGTKHRARTVPAARCCPPLPIDRRPAM